MGPAWPGLPARGETLGKNGGSTGLSPHWVSGSCDDPAGAPVPWLSQAMVLRRQPCRGAGITCVVVVPWT